MTQSDSKPRNAQAKAAVRTLHTSRAEAMPYLETGIPVGLAGAIGVAVIVFVLDLISGQPLATPNALGAAIFRGMPFDFATPIEAINVFSYTLLHSALFVIAATAAITMEFTLTKHNVSLNSQFVMGIVCLFVALQTSIMTMLLLLDVPIVDDFSTNKLLAINALAATAMATAFYRRATLRLAEK